MSREKAYHFEIVIVCEGLLAFTTVVMIFVLVFDPSVVRRPRLITDRALPLEVVQSFHVLKSRSFRAKVAGAAITLKCRSTVASGTYMVLASLPSCLEDFPTCTTFKLAAHGSGKEYRRNGGIERLREDELCAMRSGV